MIDSDKATDDEESEEEAEARYAREDAAEREEWERDNAIWENKTSRDSFYDANPHSLVRAIATYEQVQAMNERLYPRDRYPFMYEHESAGSDPEPALLPWQLYLKDHPQIVATLLEGHPVAAASLYRPSSSALLGDQETRG